MSEYQDKAYRWPVSSAPLPATWGTRRGTAHRGGPEGAPTAWCSSTRSAEGPPGGLQCAPQVLDDGRAHRWPRADGGFRNTVIIMTSNLGSQWIQQYGATDYARMKAMVTETLKESFKTRVPEPDR